MLVGIGIKAAYFDWGKARWVTGTVKDIRVFPAGTRAYFDGGGSAFIWDLERWTDA